MKSQKQFILETLLPYKQDPTTCGVFIGSCRYLTGDGKKCAVGKHMKKGPWQKSRKSVGAVLEKYLEEKVLNKSALNQNFTLSQWYYIQSYHDCFSMQKAPSMLNSIVYKLEQSLNITLTELKF
jgi:hypothetical protein